MNSAIRRLDLGYFVRPASETGTGSPRVEPVLGYLVRLDDGGLLLFDTGLGQGEADLDAHYRPHRRGLDEALNAAGVQLSDVTMVVNCHLHFDHCGGNPELAGREVERGHVSGVLEHRAQVGPVAGHAPGVGGDVVLGAPDLGVEGADPVLCLVVALAEDSDLLAFSRDLLLDLGCLGLEVGDLAGAGRLG